MSIRRISKRKFEDESTKDFDDHQAANSRKCLKKSASEKCMDLARKVLKKLERKVASAIESGKLDETLLNMIVDNVKSIKSGEVHERLKALHEKLTEKFGSDIIPIVMYSEEEQETDDQEEENSDNESEL